MTFSDPSMLAALVALAIPLAIHLLGRRRARTVLLPTARFAEGAHQAAKGWLWLKRLALLSLRLAVVGLLVLVLAGPRLAGARHDREAAGTPATSQTPATSEGPRGLPPAARTIRVLVVDAAEEKDARLRSADLVAATLGGDAAAKQVLQRRRAADVDRAALEAADVVFWVGSGGPPAQGLLEPGAARGGLVWVPADPVGPDAALARALGLAAGGVQQTAEGITIDPAGYTSDLLAAFEGGTSGDAGAPVFRRRLALDASWPAALRFRDGPAAAVQRQTGQGRTVALAAGPSPVWGDLAGRAEFVVLMHSLAEALAPPRMTAGGPQETAVPKSQGRPEEKVAAGPVTDLAGWLVVALAMALAAESILAAVQAGGRTGIARADEPPCRDRGVGPS